MPLIPNDPDNKLIDSELNVAPAPVSQATAQPMTLLGTRVVGQFRYRVLVVDDEPSIREVFQRILESEGYEVLTAGDGLDALLVLKKSLPDVIISDLHMPRMSGFELLKIVRQRFPHIGIIAMSGQYVPDQGLNTIMADTFWQKAQPIKNLFPEIARVVGASPMRSEREKKDIAPLFVQRGEGGKLIITCPNCLRLNPLDAISLNGGVHETTCRSCGEPVKFEINHEVMPLPQARA
jgi:CheY-like chemotaxis protein